MDMRLLLGRPVRSPGLVVSALAIAVFGVRSGWYSCETLKTLSLRVKYVNMTDINEQPRVSPARAPAAGPARGISEQAIVELVELLFFAYRDFVADPDKILVGYGFGRAHHRVLHFVGRSPGMRVQELLDILRITKQSLARVLRELIDQGFIYQIEGEADRRQRLLYLTPEGEALHRRLMAPQIERVRRALAAAGEPADGQYRRVLAGLAGDLPGTHPGTLPGAGELPAGEAA
jgi:DNA-binding MarR family transcriptional regulator